MKVSIKNKIFTLPNIGDFIEVKDHIAKVEISDIRRIEGRTIIQFIPNERGLMDIEHNCVIDIESTLYHNELIFEETK